MKNTIDMAREAVCDELYAERVLIGIHFKIHSLKAFEALVRADQDEKYKWDIHSCGPTCKRYACVAMREAVEAEREACAKVCENKWSSLAESKYGEECADAIRARENT
jgi:hypothetical protein